MAERESPYLWSTTALTNGAVDPQVNFAEGQLPGTVNNSNRAVMAAVARFLKDSNGSLSTTGSANAYLLTINGTQTAYATGQIYSFKASFANTAAATLNVTNADATAIGAKAIRKGGDVALAANDIVSGQHCLCQYDAAANSAAGAFILLNPAKSGTSLLSTDISDSTSVGRALLVAVDAHAAYNAINLPFFLTNYIAGLVLTYLSTTTFSVGIGAATDVARAGFLYNSAALTKSTSSWAVGSGNGGIDAGSIANSTWYHVYIIRRSDTGVVDALFSTSASAPTMPANYDQKRRIGSIKTNGSAQFIQWVQDGDLFQWVTPANDISSTNPGTSAVTRTLNVPTGVRVRAQCFVTGVAPTSTDGLGAIYISDLNVTDTAPLSNGVGTFEMFSVGTNTDAYGGTVFVMTNTSGQVRSRVQISAAGTVLNIATMAWFDLRGRDG